MCHCIYNNNCTNTFLRFYLKKSNVKFSKRINYLVFSFSLQPTDQESKRAHKGPTASNFDIYRLQVSAFYSAPILATSVIDSNPLIWSPTLT